MAPQNELIGSICFFIIRITKSKKNITERDKMEEQKIIYAGAGCAAIQFPTDYFPIEGYESLLDELHARAVILKQNTEMLLISLELPSIRPFELIDIMREQLSEETGISKDNIWITVTHSLSAPHVPQINEERIEEDAERKHREHIEAITSAMKEAVLQAGNNMQQAAIGVSSGNSNVICNRNIQTEEGWWVGISPKGPSDKTLFVIKIESVTGKPIALIYNYALKSCVLENTVMSDGKKYASADLCGTTSVYVENHLHIPTLFFMGAAGDQVPMMKGNYYDTDDNGHMREVNLGECGCEFLSKLGEKLGDDIIALAQTVECTKEIESFHHYQFDFWAPGQIRYPKEYPRPPVKQYVYQPAEKQKIHVEAIRINQDIILGVKPEILTVTNMLLKRKSPFFHTMLFTMVNGGQDYIPEDQDYERFEYPALHATVARGTDKLFLKEVIDWLIRLYYE